MNSVLDRTHSLVVWRPSIRTMFHERIAKREEELRRLREKERLAAAWELQDLLWAFRT